ncbi:MAG: DUF393 domain-containing protein [Candidatus Eisenbacteria bacterium]
MSPNPPPDPEPPAPRGAGRHVILFDGVCDLCNTGVAWIRRRDRDGRLEFVAYQSDEARRRFPALDPERLAREMHVVAPDGEVRAGVAAAPWVFAVLPGWRWLARALSWPILRGLARPVYAWIAARRRLFRAAGSCPPPRR